MKYAKNTISTTFRIQLIQPGRQSARNRLNPVDAREEHRKLRREIEQRAREDDGHHAGRVDLNGQVG